MHLQRIVCSGVLPVDINPKCLLPLQAVDRRQRGGMFFAGGGSRAGALNSGRRDAGPAGAGKLRLSGPPSRARLIDMSKWESSEKNAGQAESLTAFLGADFSERMTQLVSRARKLSASPLRDCQSAEF